MILKISQVEVIQRTRLQPTSFVLCRFGASQKIWKSPSSPPSTAPNLVNSAYKYLSNLSASSFPSQPQTPVLCSQSHFNSPSD